MVAGRGFWILVWYGILVLGLIGLWASINWGRRLKWQNLDELLRAIGTIQVSIGMLLLLYGTAERVATGLLGLALGVFVAAFVAGRNLPPPKPRDDDDDDSELNFTLPPPGHPEPEPEPEPESEHPVPAGDRFP
jgi:hypothetical protein